MVTYLQAIILGIVQGITEWLPVSSSGHLVIFDAMFGMKPNVAFDVLLHIATLLVIFCVFWEDIAKIVTSIVLWKRNEHFRLGMMILIGSIPTALIGYFFVDFFEGLFTNLLVVGIALVFTGFLLFFSKFNHRKNTVRWYDSVLIGTVQGLAIIPGVSRSGATVSTGLLLGIRKELVAKFSFILATPAILGAFLFKLGEIKKLQVMPSVVGFIITLVIGYLTLRWLLSIIKHNKFHHFCWYCWVVGIIVIMVYLF